MLENIIAGECEARKDDAEKLDWTLLPWNAVHEVVKVLVIGARKYAPNNWKKVTNAKKRYLSATYRHLYAVSEGESRDQETGQLHLAMAATNLLFCIWFEITENK